MMTTTETWWKNLFEGNLALGINHERLDELDGETFLYFKEEREEESEVYL